MCIRDRADISRNLSLTQLEAAGGVTKLSGSEQPIRTLAKVKSADELANMDILLSDGRKVRLNQVANVIDTIAEPKSAAFLNGKSVIGFEVTRSKGASELEVGAGVYKVLDAIKLAHPDIEITEAFNFVQPVQEEFDASMTMLYEGALLAVLVVWLFLRDFRATFVLSCLLYTSRCV